MPSAAIFDARSAIADSFRTPFQPPPPATPMPEKPPSPAPTTDLAGALGDALGRRADGQPDLAALVVPLLRSGAGAALIGSLLGGSSNQPAAPAVTGPAADPHPLDDAPARHGGAGSPLAAILPPVTAATTATTAPRTAADGTAARLAMLLAQGLPKR